MDFILEQLNAQQDTTYRQFQSGLTPTVEPSKFIGVRTPILRRMAKQLRKDERCAAFLAELPHTYFEENQLHGFIVSENPDFANCLQELEQFLPYIDNWATCDQTSPKVFCKHKEELLPHIQRWLATDHEYTVRFAIGMLMQHFLDESFRSEYLDWVTALRSDAYYINMEIAWYMATALAKQWGATIPYLETPTLDKWTHNRTIQKARESYRITEEQKEYLKSLRR
jgi:3-methyladenine DNA glycosylase AlkD